MKQTSAVEWLVRMYQEKGKLDYFDIKQAKALEQENLKTAVKNSWCTDKGKNYKDPEEDKYYNET